MWLFRSSAFIMACVTLPLLGLCDPLLPHPQEIHYGSGHLALRSLAITFGTTPGPGDRFAAEELSSALSRRAGSHIRIVAGQPSTRGIILYRTGPTDDLPQPGERPGPNSPEAYSIRIDADHVEVRARSSRGLFYGIQTLCQMVEGQGSGAAFPIVEVRDWPYLAYRGVMMDMSHGPLPREDEVERELDFLSHFKVNQYYLYNEASIELKGYPLINPGGRFSQTEIRHIIKYGRSRHIDVIPNLELYAHLHDLFRIEEYAGLADIPHGVEFDPRNPRVMPLLADWISQFVQLFPSPFVHVGFDETFQIRRAAEQGESATTPVELFATQLTKVTQLLQERGKHVMAWDDVMVEYPAIFSELPPGLIGVAWQYHPQPDPTYQYRLAPLVDHHIPHFIQPGVTAYAQVVPDFNLSFANIDDFLAAGRRSTTLLGLINSIWADDGEILFRMTLPGMAYGAAAAWQSAPVDRARFFSDYSAIVYPPSVAPDVGAALQALAESESDLQKAVGEQTMFAFWRDPLFTVYLQELEGHEGDLRASRLAAENAEAHLGTALGNGGDPATLNSLVLGSRLLDYAGQRFETPVELADLWTRVGPRRPDADTWWNEWESQVVYQDHSRIVDLMDAITELRAAYQREWLAEYTPYRLGSALGRFDAEYEYWRRFQDQLQEFSDSTHEGTPLPPLSSLAH